MYALQNVHLLSQIEQYANNHTKDEGQLLKNLELETKNTMHGPEMLSGKIQGQFLKFLVKMVGAKTALEFGTYTGYSALAIASALPAGGTLTTIEANPVAIAIAQKYFKLSPDGHKITVINAKALTAIGTINAKFDFIFIDADKKNIIEYYEAAKDRLNDNGIIVIDNMLWGGDVLNPTDGQAIAIDKLNKLILQDNTVDNILLTIRDGINIVYKK